MKNFLISARVANKSDFTKMGFLHFGWTQTNQGPKSLLSEPYIYIMARGYCLSAIVLCFPEWGHSKKMIFIFSKPSDFLFRPKNRFLGQPSHWVGLNRLWKTVRARAESGMNNGFHEIVDNTGRISFHGDAIFLGWKGEKEGKLIRTMSLLVYLALRSASPQWELFLKLLCLLRYILKKR